jgi:hypothetical protein
MVRKNRKRKMETNKARNTRRKANRALEQIMSEPSRISIVERLTKFKYGNEPG